MINNVYTYNPIKYNNLNQAQTRYVGIDEVTECTLRKGTILVALEGPKAGFGGDYFITLDNLKNSNLDSINLCQGVQVAPYYNKNDEDSHAQYKTNARLYVVNEDILVASGITNANTNYGKGGLQQIVVPNGSVMIQNAYKNDNYSVNNTIIPVNLNNFQNDERLSKETKKELDDFKTQFSNNICIDGSVTLDNKEISYDAYSCMMDRNKIHEIVAENNCILKDYTDELGKSCKDISYLTKLREELGNKREDLQNAKSTVEISTYVLLENEALLDGFNDEQKEYILNVDTCCPKETLEKSEYLKAKASELEKNLSYDEKKLLNIEDDASSDKVNNFKENTKLEESIKEDYENYIRIDPEGVVNRELIYTPIERDKNEDTDGRRTALGEKDQLYEENSNENDRTNLELSSDNTMDSKKVLSQTEEQNIDENEVINSEETLEEKQNQNYLTNEETENNKVLGKNLVNDSKVDIENNEIKVIDEAAASEVSEEDSALKDVNENLEENQNCEGENSETSKTADDNKDVSIVGSTQTEKDQKTDADIEASIKNANNTEDEIAGEGENKNKLESKEELSEGIDYKNINEDKNLEVDAQQNSIEGQIISEKHDENLEINKELENNEISDKIEGNKEKNETVDHDENSNKNDNTSLELSSDNTMDSKKVLSQTEEQNIDEDEVINSEEALEKVENENYLNNEETENNKVLEENLVNDSKVDIENDEIKVRDEAAVSEASGEDSVLKDANENLEQNQDCEDENFEISETADDNNDMLSFDDNLEKMDNENCDENEKLKDCDEEAIESSVNCNGTASREELDEDLDEDEDEFYDY